MTEQRRRRQRNEIAAIGSGGDLSRAVALVRDHLLEFPGDVDLGRAVAGWVAGSGGEDLLAEAQDLLTSRSTDARVPP